MLNDILLFYVGKSIDDKKILRNIPPLLSQNNTREAEEKVKSLIAKYYNAVAKNIKFIDNPSSTIFEDWCSSAKLDDIKSRCFVTINNNDISEISLIKALQGYRYSEVVEYIDTLKPLLKDLHNTKFYILLIRDRSTKDMDDGFDIFHKYVADEFLKVITIIDFTDTFRLELYEIKHIDTLFS